MKRTSITIFFAMLVNIANAMDFDQLGGTFTMGGEIEKDDSVKFILSLASCSPANNYPHIVYAGDA